VRPATVARLVLGAALAGAPRRVLDLVGGPDAHEELTADVARVLGARMLVQAAADHLFGARVRRLGIAVDLAHAASMVPVAVRWPEHRRTAVVSATAAAGTAALAMADPH
jgi:hypothetical protein